MKAIPLYSVLFLLLLPLFGLAQENELQLCSDGIDNDGDGKIDCQDEDCLFLLECAKRLVYIPNAFSPDSDGINDLFVIYGGQGTEVIRFLGIYNRLGQQVFEARNFLPNDPSWAWDGSYRGRLKNPGVYLYLLQVELSDGTIHQLTGDFALFR